MTQITPNANQTNFPITLGLLGSPPRIALFCPSTGLLLDTVLDARYDWTSTAALTLVLSTDQAMAPAGYTGLAARAELKPFSADQPTVVDSGATVTLSRPFPTSTTSSVASFNVWVTGESPAGNTGIIAWHDPTWPVGKTGSGGPGNFAAQQTSYFYLAAASQTITLDARSDSSGNTVWLQTPHGAMVGATMVAATTAGAVLVVSPPQSSVTGTSLKVVVDIRVPGVPTISTTILATVGTATSASITYGINGTTQIITVEILAEHLTIPPVISESPPV